jgi:hypothetical protein
MHDDLRERRTEGVTVRLEKDLKQAIEAKAYREGRSVAGYLRWLALRNVEDERVVAG